MSTPLIVPHLQITRQSRNETESNEGHIPLRRHTATISNGDQER